MKNVSIPNFTIYSSNLKHKKIIFCENRKRINPQQMKVTNSTNLFKDVKQNLKQKIIKSILSNRDTIAKQINNNSLFSKTSRKQNKNIWQKFKTQYHETFSLNKDFKEKQQKEEHGICRKMELKPFVNKKQPSTIDRKFMVRRNRCRQLSLPNKKIQKLLLNQDHSREDQTILPWNSSQNYEYQGEDLWD